MLQETLDKPVKDRMKRGGATCTSIPNLQLDLLAHNLDYARSKLYADGVWRIRNNCSNSVRLRKINIPLVRGNLTFLLSELVQQA